MYFKSLICANENCKKEFFANDKFDYKKRKYCSRSCIRKGKHHTEETKKLKSKIAKEYGIGKWMLGKKASKETREKQSKALKGKSYEELYGKEEAERLKKLKSEKRKQYLKEHPELLKEWSLKRAKTIQKKKEEGTFKQRSWKGGMSKSDKVINDFILQNCLPFKYTGNGLLRIGKNVQCIPDFAKINEGKDVIEDNGCFWHGCDLCYPNWRKCKRAEIITRMKTKDLKKEQIYKECGYRLITIWEHEVKDGSFKEKLLSLK